jgi:hypothetical protein
VYWRNGYEGASMTELADAMGITKPSLCAAFAFPILISEWMASQLGF